MQDTNKMEFTSFEQGTSISWTFQMDPIGKKRIEKSVGCPNVRFSLVYGWKAKKSWQLEDISTKVSRKLEFLNRKIAKFHRWYHNLFQFYFVSSFLCFSSRKSQQNTWSDLCMNALMYAQCTHTNEWLHFFLCFVFSSHNCDNQKNWIRPSTNAIISTAAPSSIDTYAHVHILKWNSLVWFG